MSRWYCSSFTIAFVVRVVCFTSSLLPSLRLARSLIQQIIVSTSCDAIGWLLGRQIMSPREMSISSLSRTVTAIGANASSSGPSRVSIDLMDDWNPDGRTVTSSPGRRTPPAIVPA